VEFIRRGFGGKHSRERRMSWNGFAGPESGKTCRKLAETQAVALSVADRCPAVETPRFKVRAVKQQTALPYAEM